MTLPASAREIGHRLPSESERAAANQLRRLLAAQGAGKATLQLIDEGTTKRFDVLLTPALSSVLMELLRHLGSGDAVTLVPVSKMLTTQQAADILNVSRPFLITLLEKGDISFQTVGRHRRIKANDLFVYKRARDERRSKALETLAELDAELL